MVNESGVRSLHTSIDDLALLVLQKIKVLVALVNALHSLMAKCLRNDLSSILDN